MVSRLQKEPESAHVFAGPIPWRQLILTLVLIATTVWIYTPALHGDWLWDDDMDIAANTVIHSPDGLGRIWFEPGCEVDYYPLKASVQWLQWHVWGGDTFGYHVTNLVLHLLSALLVWRLFARWGLRFAWFGALLFAIHPMQVESVAWIAELKNALSLPLFLLSLLFWLDYEEHRRWRDYLPAFGFFIAAMLAKPAMVMFPVFIFLLAWWKRGRIDWSDARNAAPFFAVSLLLGWIALSVGEWYRQAHHGGVAIMPMGGWETRFALAGLSTSFYLRLFLWPSGLLPLYPKWNVDPPDFIQFIPTLLIIAGLVWCWMHRAVWGRHVLLGAGFFLIMLAPFVCLNAGGFTTLTWVMNHFLYLPGIGLIGLVMAGMEASSARLAGTWRRVSTALMGVIAAFLAWQSHGDAALYQNEETLWSHTVIHNPGAWLAHNHLGNAYYLKDRLAEAQVEYETAVRLNSLYADAHSNLGNVLFRTGHAEAAIAQYRLAFTADPDYAKAHHNLGVVLLQLGRIPEAIPQYEEALRLNPDDTEARETLERLQAPR